MAKKYSEFTEEQKQAICKERTEKALTARELAKKHNTSETIIYQIFKDQKSKEAKQKQEKKAEQHQEAKSVINELLKGVEVEEPKVPEVGIAEYQALFNISTEQTAEIDRLEKELKTAMESLQKEAAKSIEKDREIEVLKSEIGMYKDEVIAYSDEEKKSLEYENNTLKDKIHNLGIDLKNKDTSIEWFKKENTELREKIADLEKPKKELSVDVNMKNLDSYEQMRQLFTVLIFDGRVEKKVRQEYAFRAIEAEK